MDLISYPMRLDKRGSIQTTEDGEDYYAEELAMLIKTSPGERALVPDYGIADPTFNTVDQAELLAQISFFGPPVTIESITSVPVKNDIFRLSIDYTGTDIEDPDYPTYGAPEYTDNTDYDEDLENEEFGFTDATDF